jgi:hypothetical protein
MGNANTSQLQAIDESVLTPLVQRVLNREDAKILHWQYQPLTGGVELESSLYRFIGDARTRSGTILWAMILKIIRSSAEDNNDPLSFRYWRREALAYQSGILNDLPGGIAAPRCFATEEKPEGAYWIWMEAVKDESGDTWPLSRYGIVARYLGRFNGAYLVGKPLPNQLWMTRQWLRKYLDHAAPAVDRLIHSMDHPLIRRCLPGISADFIQKIWNERIEILGIIESLPKTFCHQDAFRRNLFFQHMPEKEPQVVAVDWSYSGIAAVGEEIAPLVHASLSFGAVPAEDAFRLEQIVLDGYMDGLRDAGWQPNPDMIRFSYAATIYWRYAIGGFAGEMVPWLLEESYHAAIEQAWGKTMEQLADETASSIGWVNYIYDQASKLKAVLKENA